MTPQAVIAFCGVVAPEAMQAYDELSAQGPLQRTVALLQVCGVVYAVGGASEPMHRTMYAYR